MQKKERQSGVELLRIISMFLVLIIHANAFGVKWDALDLDNSLASGITTIALQSVSCVCVNVFVLISGWFGIRFSWRGLTRFLFQCFFFLFGIYIVMLFGGKTTLSIEGLAGCFMFLKWNWFIKAYIVLYFVSPVLNRFLDATNERELKNILLLFFVFQTLYGWLTNGAFFFEYGCSVTSFVGLYLLAQYVRRFLLVRLVRKQIWGGITLLFVTLTIVLFAIVCVSAKFHVNFVVGKIFAYTSPFVILNALLLLLIFVNIDKKGFKNLVINKVAMSSFAVFLLHTHPCVFSEYYQKTFIMLYESSPWYVFLLLLLMSSTIIFMAAVLIDQIRILCWNKIANHLFK